MTATVAPQKTRSPLVESRSAAAASIASDLIEHAAQLQAPYGLIPVGAGSAIETRIQPGDLPQTINDLPVQLSRTYELSVTAAAQLNIPVIDSVSGGFSRRVVVLERTAYKELEENGTRFQYGYAITKGRFCVQHG